MENKDLIERIQSLSKTELEELESFLDYLRYKKRKSNQLSSDDLLRIYGDYGINSWKEMASRILNSGIIRGPVGGYMKRSHVNDWICEKFNVDEAVAEKTIKILIDKHMIDYSSYGNLG